MQLQMSDVKNLPEGFLLEDLQKIGEIWFDELPELWKKWVLENIERGCAAEELMQILSDNGFGIDINRYSAMPTPLISLEETDKNQILDMLINDQEEDILNQYKHHDQIELKHYIQNIKQEKIYQQLEKYRFELKKRHWLLNTLDQLAQLNPHYSTQIKRISTPAFSRFIQDYYSQHRPVIMTGGIDHWKARQWTPEYFKKNVGQSQIEVQMGRDKVQDFERKSYALKQNILMQDYVDQVLSAGQSNNFYMTANNNKNSQHSLASLFDDIADFGQGYCNLSLKNDLCFLWFGPQGTFTPLHHDLTNNMLVQIYGRKKVMLLPALQVQHLYNDHWVFSEISDPRQVNLQTHPNWKNITPVECILEPGDALFIPIGWWHSVESLDISISVSFTHFNAPNHFSQSFPREKT